MTADVAKYMILVDEFKSVVLDGEGKAERMAQWFSSPDGSGLFCRQHQELVESCQCPTYVDCLHPTDNSRAFDPLSEMNPQTDTPAAWIVQRLLDRMRVLEGNVPAYTPICESVYVVSPGKSE